MQIYAKHLHKHYAKLCKAMQMVMQSFANGYAKLCKFMQGKNVLRSRIRRKIPYLRLQLDCFDQGAGYDDAMETSSMSIGGILPSSTNWL